MAEALIPLTLTLPHERGEGTRGADPRSDGRSAPGRGWASPEKTDSNPEISSTWGKLASVRAPAPPGGRAGRPVPRSPPDGDTTPRPTLKRSW